MPSSVTAARTLLMAPCGSWIISFIHRSDTWFWMTGVVLLPSSDSKNVLVSAFADPPATCTAAQLRDRAAELKKRYRPALREVGARTAESEHAGDAGAVSLARGGTLGRYPGTHMPTPMPAPSATKPWSSIFCRSVRLVTKRWLGAPPIPLLYIR